jgi:hypothetical protein
MMAVYGVVLSLVGVVFGDWFWLEGFCGGVGCASLVGDIESWRRGVAGFQRWMWLGVLVQGGGVV